MKRRTRRLYNLAGLALACLCVQLWVRLRWLSLGASQRASGWLLLGLVVFLLLYNLRKKLPFLPLLASASWLQAHIWLGLLACFSFLLHSGAALPSGVLERGLAVLFLMSAGSGLLGLYLSRRIPPMLRTRGEEVIFERIPGLLRRLRERAEDLVVRAVEQTGSTAISDYYTRRLQGFFSRPRHLGRHLVSSHTPIRKLALEIEDLERYLGADERPLLAELAAMVQAKHDLDYHYALQGSLKLWLFVHLPFSYALLVLVALHVLTIQAFGSAL